LDLIARLNCAPTDCNSSVNPPEKIASWQTEMKKRAVDQETYSKALAGVYREMICSGDGNALAVLRSLASMGLPEGGDDPDPPFSGFLEPGREAIRLVETIMGKECPVSTLLVDGDKSLLSRVKRIAAKVTESSAPSR